MIQSTRLVHRIGTGMLDRSSEPSNNRNLERPRMAVRLVDQPYMDSQFADSVYACPWKYVILCIQPLQPDQASIKKSIKILAVYRE